MPNRLNLDTIGNSGDGQRYSCCRAGRCAYADAATSQHELRRDKSRNEQHRRAAQRDSMRVPWSGTASYRVSIQHPRCAEHPQFRISARPTVRSSHIITRPRLRAPCSELLCKARKVRTQNPRENQKQPKQKHLPSRSSEKQAIKFVLVAVSTPMHPSRRSTFTSVRGDTPYAGLPHCRARS